MQILLLPYRLSRDAYVGTRRMQFLVVNWMRLPAFLALGRIDAGEPRFVGEPAAARHCLYLARVQPPGRVYGLLVLVGAKLIWDGWTSL